MNRCNCSSSGGTVSPYCDQHCLNGYPTYIKNFFLNFIKPRQPSYYIPEMIIYWNSLPIAPTFESRIEKMNVRFPIASEEAAVIEK